MQVSRLMFGGRLDAANGLGVFWVRLGSSGVFSARDVCTP